MCGIAGWVGDGIDPGRFAGALGLEHRGPDGAGTWTGGGGRALLGHRRLAILDTSPLGAQPSLAPDGGSAFIHNGEIYNFRALRRELEAEGERFVSQRRRRGRAPACSSGAGRGRSRGSRACSPSPSGRRAPGRLLLARDPIGIKPLYYAVLPRGLAFASEPRALLVLPDVSSRLDPDALSDFLAYGYVPFDRCLFAGIRKLPAAHRLTWEADGRRLEVEPYWRLEPKAVRDDPEELRERLDRAIRSQLVSDVPVGAFLSGGLDSTLVAARASRAQPLPTFTVAYRDGDLDDVRFARLAAESFGTPHTRRAARSRRPRAGARPRGHGLRRAPLRRPRARDARALRGSPAAPSRSRSRGTEETRSSAATAGTRRRFATSGCAAASGFAAPFVAAAGRAVVEPLARTRAGGGRRGRAVCRRDLRRSLLPRAGLLRRGRAAAAPAPRSGRRRMAFPALRPARAPDRAAAPLARPSHVSPRQRPDARGPLDHGRGSRSAGSAPRPPARRVRVLPSARAARHSGPDEGGAPRGDRALAARGDPPPAQEGLFAPLQALGPRPEPRGGLPPDRDRRPRRGRRPRRRARRASSSTSSAQRRHNKLWLLLNLEAWYRRWIRRRVDAPFRQSGVARPELV